MRGTQDGDTQHRTTVPRTEGEQLIFVSLHSETSPPIRNPQPATRNPQLTTILMSIMSHIFVQFAAVAAATDRIDGSGQIEVLSC